MSKYLDYAGLQYLWTKIKNYVSTQPLGANVRYDVQSLTDAQSSQARTNIKAGSTNPNILINGYFVGGAGANSFPINSRGLTTYTGSTWTVDCWRTWDGGSTVTIGTWGLTFSNNLNGDALFQYIKDPVYLYGKTITISAIINGKLYSATGTASSSARIATADEDVYSLRFSVDNVSGYGYVCVQIVSGKTITIEAIKLELGAVSTIVGDIPKDRELEYIRSVSYPVFYGDTVAGRAITPTSNRNLLDNAYFVGGGSQLGDGIFPINQRGQTSYTSAGFVFDRWLKSGGVTATLDAGGLTIVNSNGWPDGINQRFPMHFFAQMNGQAITASVLYADGSVDSGTAIIDATQNYQWLKYPEAGKIGFQLKNFQDGAAYDYFDYISFGAGANSTPKKIKAVKLELGTVSTLANDPPPDFGEELRKCQRYLRDVSLRRTPCYFDGTYSVAVLTLTGIEMAKSPTPSLITAGFAWQPAASASANLTAVSLITFEQYTPTIQFPLTAALSGMGMIYDTVVRLSCEL